MVAGGQLGLLAEDHLEILQCPEVPGQAATTDRRAGLVPGTTALSVGQVHQAVTLELR
ncbi:hypothetical protein D3C81_2226800 [compost metagenome]